MANSFGVGRTREQDFVVIAAALELGVLLRMRKSTLSGEFCERSGSLRRRLARLRCVRLISERAMRGDCSPLSDYVLSHLRRGHVLYADVIGMVGDTFSGPGSRGSFKSPF